MRAGRLEAKRVQGSGRRRQTLDDPCLPAPCHRHAVHAPPHHTHSHLEHVAVGHKLHDQRQEGLGGKHLLELHHVRVQQALVVHDLAVRVLHVLLRAAGGGRWRGRRHMCLSESAHRAAGGRARMSGMPVTHGMAACRAALHPRSSARSAGWKPTPSPTRSALCRSWRGGGGGAAGRQRRGATPAGLTHSTRVNLMATCSRVSRFSASTTKPKLPLLMSLILR